MSKKQYHHGDLKNALIRAGAEILAREGVAGLTLRKAAQRAGVSHSAPYAHFADKRAMVAAISTEGLRTLRDRIAEAIASHEGDPLRSLAETAWETVRFALEQPDHYRITFSNVIEREAEHPEYQEMARVTFERLVGLVRACQVARVIPPGPPGLATVELWSLVHGLILLVINNQLPHTIREQVSPRALLLHALASHLRAPTLAALGGKSPRTRPPPRRAGRRPAGQS